MNIKVLVATHKPYRMPADPMYIPLHVGHKGKGNMGYIGDDIGDNISERNPFYSELTGTYWAWKNLDADAVGIAHYRRHFTTRCILQYKIAGKWNSILTTTQAEKLLKDNDIILPNKRRYWIETNGQHYAHASPFRPNELILMRQIIDEQCPEYVPCYETVLNRTWAHMFNMFIMKKPQFDTFCAWMFPLLFAYEERLDRSAYPSKENRAWIDELMLDVWLEREKYTACEIHAMYMEKQNWVKKGGAMIYRKFLGRESCVNEGNL